MIHQSSKSSNDRLHSARPPGSSPGGKGGRLAMGRPLVLGRHARTMLVHVRVRVVRPHLGKGELVRAHELAELVIWIGRHALWRPRDWLGQDLEPIHVEVGLLHAVDLVADVLEEARRLPDEADKHVAHHRLAPRLRAVVVDLGVVRLVLLNDGDDTLQRHLPLCSLLVQLRGLEASGGVAHDVLVPRFEVYLVHGLQVLPEEGEKRLDELPTQTILVRADVRRQARVVVIDGVEPAHQQRCITVVQTLLGVEKPVGGLVVEHLPILFREGSVHHGVAGLSSESYPLLVRSSLNAVGGPICALRLALRDVELAVLPHGHDRVPRAGAHRPSEHGVQAVKPDDAQEVPGVDLRGVEHEPLRIVGARLHLAAHVLLHEVQGVRLDPGRRGIDDQRNKHQCRLKEVADETERAIPKAKHADPVRVHVPDLALAQVGGVELERLRARDRRGEGAELHAGRGGE
mmetsp:Transcript_412/g.1380  ORF Transcript_412/g.1380 Transcript_412/m.1380 type:complete len:459 (-) Transcript_412:707-2083(-)